MIWRQRLPLTLARALCALVLLVTANVGGAAAASSTPRPACGEAIAFSPGSFSSPTRIDNRWLPMVPGTQLVLEGSADRGGGVLPHRVVFTVTDLTKVIDGVRTRVVWDTDYDEGELVESELTFFAQDDAGNVWNLGEYPEEYEDGALIGAPSTWISGLEGAKAGVHMLAAPAVGTHAYLQGLAARVGFLDCAQVLASGQSATVPYGDFSDVLVTNEWSPLDATDGFQQKYHASGVGIVQVGAVDDPEGETLRLVQVKRLSPGALAKVREQALALDRRGYSVSEVYSATAPAE